jgi:hypothetical protein
VRFTCLSTRRLAVLALASNAVFVTGGLALVRAPARVWQALALAPLFALWKLRLLLRLWMRRAPAQWVKLERGRP